MSRTEQELRELYRTTFAMPKGPARFAALEEVMRHADALGLVEFAFDVRMNATSVFQHSWVPAKAFLAYSWCLAAYDREPERFGAGAEHRLLWNIKWMIYSVHQFPEIPLRRAHDLLDDMERRYRRGGHSMHAVLQHRGLIAESVGELDRAQDFYEQMSRTRRDGLSDCAGCVPSSQVRTLVALGRDEEAIRIGEPARVTGCSEQPQWINSELLLPYVRTGRGAQALEAHRTAYRRIRDNPHHLAELALHLLFCAHTGNARRGLDLIERHLSWLDDARTPLAEGEFAAAAVAVLGELERQGEGGRTLRFPTVEGRRRPDVTVAALAVELRERARGIAARFDTRNGNDYQSTRLGRWMAAGPIGEPLPLSVFSAAAHAGSAPGAERVRPLVERVAAATAAGDLATAARTRVAVAEALLEVKRPQEAQEAAEEAVRELDRLGMTEDAGRCRLLLAHAYAGTGHQGEAARHLRSLLDDGPSGSGTATGAGTGTRSGEIPGLPPRPELEDLLGSWLGYGPEASRRHAAAARGFAAAGRTEERLAALRRALSCHPDPAAVDPLLADAEAALADPGSAAAPAEDRAGLRMACARTLYVEGRTEEAARQLEAARALLTAPAGSRGTARLLGEALAGLASIRLLLDAPDAAEEAARAALEALEGAVDDPWDETAWHAAVVLVRILRARGATEEAERLMTAHEVTEDELEAWTGWED
jgi:tetratricopeptide (TPR) repeat protein